MSITRKAQFLAVALALAGAATVAQAQDFAGKTITIINSNPPGSGGDLHGRIFAKYFGRHLPGTPEVIVINKTGGSGAAAMNFVYETGTKDGTTLCYCGFDAAAVIAEAPGIRYVPENMDIIGSAVTNLVFTARKDRVPDPASLTDDSALLIGGRGAGSAMGTMGNLGLRVLDANYRYIPGYGGFSKISASMLADEVHAGHAGLSGFLRFFGWDHEDIGAVYYHPVFDAQGAELPRDSASLPETLPSISELHQSLHGVAPSGQWWDAYVWYRSKIMSATIALTTPPGLEPGLVDVLQDAFQKTTSDPEYLAEYRETISEPPTFNSTEMSESLFSGFRDMPAGVAEALQEIVSE